MYTTYSTYVRDRVLDIMVIPRICMEVTVEDRDYFNL
jgi:hypothetical protein